MTTATPQTRAATGLSVLYAGFFLIDFDLVVINPLLIPVADSFDVGLGTVTLALTSYLLLFGIMQPVHGSLSDTVGRVRVLRVAFAGMGLGNLIAAFAPNVGVLIAGRCIAGGFGAAVIPLTMAYIGDRVPAEGRQRTMAGLLSAGALGTAAATIIAGLLTHAVSWRPVFGLVAVAGPVLAALVGRLPETLPGSLPENLPEPESLPESLTPVQNRPTARQRFGGVLRGGWFRFLIAFTFVEGAAMLGFFNFFNAALEVRGHGIVLAGLVTSAYGIAALGGGVLVGMIESRTSAAAMFALGGTMLFAAFSIAAYRQNVMTILAASALAGLALSVGQSTIQTWGVEVAAPGTLGTVASLIACSVFTGAAVGTAAVGGLANEGRFGQLFAVAAAVTVPVVLVGTVARGRFDRDRVPAEYR